MTPIPTPSDFVSFYGVAIVEINSVSVTSNATVSDFVLLDKDGRTDLKMTRVISVEVFERPNISDTMHGAEEGEVAFFRDGKITVEGIAAYYFNPGDTRPWNGNLPVGNIRLRIRVALPGQPNPTHPKFKVTVGKLLIEGRVDCLEWPT